MLSPDRPKVGDIAIALRSSGIHSNGFSLVRKIIENSGAALDSSAPFDSDADHLGAALMTPTRIYRKAVAIALTTGGVTGIAHITGGGLIENPPRVFGDKVSFRLDCTATPLPPVFSWIRDIGNMELSELARTFNCGIGLIIYVDASKADEVLRRSKPGQSQRLTLLVSLLKEVINLLFSLKVSIIGVGRHDLFCRSNFRAWQQYDFTLLKQSKIITLRPKLPL